MKTMKLAFAGVCLAGALALAGCDANAVNTLNAIHSDLTTFESDLGQDLNTACGLAPTIEADVGLALSLTSITAAESADLQAAEAVISTACTNPTAANSAALVAKVTAAIAEVEAIESSVK